MKQDFWFSLSRVRVNMVSLKVYAIQSKNGIMMNIGVNVKKYMIRVFVKILCGILVRVIVSVIRYERLTNI